MKLKEEKYHCKVKDQFVKRADSFEESARWVKDDGLLDIHQKLSGASKDNLILEVCCGTGVVGEKLSRSSSKVFGLDLSLSMLNRAVRKLRFCINGRAESLPFLDEIFDVVVCRQALHFLDIKQVIKEMFRVIKPGAGRIIISQIVPFGEKDSDWLYRIHRAKQPLLKNFIDECGLKDLLEDSGFVDITSYDYCIEEPINSWLKDTYFSQEKIEAIMRMFLDAPSEYKALHHTRVIDGNIFDTMRWVVIKGRKE